MGNSISGLNPKVGVTVEQVLADFKDWNHVGVLGNSRFFKVSKIKYEDGKHGVLKVFKYPEGTKALVEKYVQTIQAYCLSSTNLTNVLPYSGCSVIRDIVVLWRKHMPYSLSERLSIRPFLRMEEKKWIAFQILCGLTQCHKERMYQQYYDNVGPEHQLCHGDLKLENIMLTDWGWVMIVDMAPFKPVYMGINNPGDFYYYFDIGGRHNCCVAPERFVTGLGRLGGMSTGNIAWAPGSGVSMDEGSTTGGKSSGGQKEGSDFHDAISPSGSGYTPSSYNDPSSIDISDPTRHTLKPAMDMFSTGCLFIELFTDGVGPFNLADLFKYQVKDSCDKLEHLYDRIQDKHVVELIRRLLDRNPETRITAEACLISQRGRLFPDIFYRELKSYMVQFLNNSTLSDPEMRISKLYLDFPQIIDTYVVRKVCRHYKNDVLILFVNLITSVIFSVTEEHNKIRSLVMLKELGLHMTEQLSLERIVPYLLEFIDIGQQSADVRRVALDCLYESIVDTAPSFPGDVCFFPDYFLPAIACLQRDPDISVRYAFTKHIPGFARTALKFLQESIKLQKKGKQESSKSSIKYDEELTRLREIFRDMIINLFSSEQNMNNMRDEMFSNSRNGGGGISNTFIDVELKCCVTEREYLSEMTQFFSVSKARDDLLSHLITFLNDKTNHIVRVRFYESLPDIIEIMGVQSATILEALLVQGLIADSCLRVVESCCHGLAQITRSGLLPDHLRASVLTDVVSLLILPHACLKLVAIDFIINFCYSTKLSTLLMSFIKAIAASSSTQDQSLSLASISTKGKIIFENNCIFKSVNPLSINLHTELSLWNNIHSSVTRSMFEDLLKHNELEQFFRYLVAKHKELPDSASGTVSFKSGSESVDNMYERLVQQGMTGVQERQLLLLRKLITAISNGRRQQMATVVVCEDHSSRVVSSQPVPVQRRIGSNYHQSRDFIPEAIGVLEIDQNPFSNTSDSFEAYPVGHSTNDINNFGPRLNTSFPYENPARNQHQQQYQQPIQQSNRGSFSNNMAPARKWTLASVVQENSTWESMFQNSAYQSSKSAAANKASSQASMGFQMDITDGLKETDDVNGEDSDDEFEDGFDLGIDQWTEKLDEINGSNRFRDSIRHRLITGSSIHAGLSPVSLGTAFLSNNNGNSASDTNIAIANDGSSNTGTNSDGVNSVMTATGGVNNSTKSSHSKLGTVSLIGGNGNLLPTAWKPRGILVASLHEHRRGITSILAHPSEKLFVSTGADKTLRFWNCDPNPSRTDPTFSKYIPNKSSSALPLVHDEYSKRGSCLKPVWLDNGDSVATVVDGQFINIANSQLRGGHTSTISPEMRSVYEFPVSQFGRINCLATPIATGSSLDSSSRHTLLYSSTGNWLVAHDTRCPLQVPNTTMWTHKQSNDYGMITCLAMHSPYTWLVAGTSRGSLVCWDLRFQRVISKLDHPNTLGFLSVNINPLFSGYLGVDDNSSAASVSVPRSNAGGPKQIVNSLSEDLANSHVWAATEDHNEVACWNLERNVRTISLQTKTSSVDNGQPVASSSSGINQSRSFLVKMSGLQERRPCVITGSTDCNLRFWDLNPTSLQASVISQGGLEQYSCKYQSSQKIIVDNNLSSNQGLLIEQTQTQTSIDQPDLLGGSDSNQRNLIRPFTGHVSSICDIGTVYLGQPFILSASTDGIIKIWK